MVPDSFDSHFVHGGSLARAMPLLVHRNGEGGAKTPCPHRVLTFSSPRSPEEEVLSSGKGEGASPNAPSVLTRDDVIRAETKTYRKATLGVGSEDRISGSGRDMACDKVYGCAGARPWFFDRHTKTRSRKQPLNMKPNLSL